MSDGNDGTGGGEGGGDPGDSHRKWPSDWRVSVAELEGYVMASTADMKAFAAESRAYAAESRAAMAELGKEVAQRENRVVKWVVGSVAVATGILSVVISLAGGALNLFTN